MKIRNIFSIQFPSTLLHIVIFEVLGLIFCHITPHTHIHLGFSCIFKQMKFCFLKHLNNHVLVPFDKNNLTVTDGIFNWAGQLEGTMRHPPSATLENWSNFKTIFWSRVTWILLVVELYTNLVVVPFMFE